MRFLREIKLELSSMVLVAGIILTTIAAAKYFLPDSFTPNFLRDVYADLGMWIVWITVLGPILLAGGGWYFLDIVRKRREFERLINTPSKAKFVRNQDRLEYLGWILSSEHERRVWEKKREFKIKE